MNNKAVIIPMVVGLVVVLIILYSVNERLRTIETNLSFQNVRNDSYYINSLNTTLNVETNIDKIEAETVIVGDKNNNTVIKQEKAT